MTKKFLALCLIVFLISGLIMGFLIGGHTTQEKWVSFYEEKNKEIEKYCQCDYLETKEYNLNLTLIFQGMR